MPGRTCVDCQRLERERSCSFDASRREKSYSVVDRRTKGEESAKAFAEAAKARRPADGEKRMASLCCWNSLARDALVRGSASWDQDGCRPAAGGGSR